jgi:hypothetical protein
MTIPEAVQLVLQAASMGLGGEVFLLEMGEPVRIVDLAADLIRLSGLEVGSDIEIRYLGMRPGEKLYEETFCEGEDFTPTSHPEIRRARNARPGRQIERFLESLILAARECRPDPELRRRLQQAVPEFNPASQPVPLPAVFANDPLSGREPTYPSAIGSFHPGTDRRDGDRRNGERRTIAWSAKLWDGPERRNALDRRCGIDRRSAAPTRLGLRKAEAPHTLQGA